MTGAADRVVVAGAVALAARAGADPDGVALFVDGGADVTYGAWERRSNAVARGLRERGIVTGARVALLFDGSCWADLAASHLGVLKAGAVAVLLPAGLPAADVARALAWPGVAGVVCGGTVRPPEPGPWWVAGTSELEGGRDGGPVVALVDPAAVAEEVHPPAPLVRPRPLARSHHELAAVVAGGGSRGGVLVHAWPAGSVAGMDVLRLVLAGRHAAAATVASFTPRRFGALVAAHGATGVGLTPGLAGAVVASARQLGLGSVRAVTLSSPPGPGLADALAAAFPGVPVEVLGGSAPASPAGGEAEVRPPAAVSQEGMVWHEQLAPGSFNLPCLVRRYEGPLDVGALRKAFAELARRHEPLRTTFELHGADVRQVVAEAGGDLAVVDLGHLAAAERDEAVDRLLQDATSVPFDLAAGPLFAPRLVRLGHDDHLLVVRLHHTAFDDWSVDVFRRELSALYASATAGTPSPLPEPTTGFGAFARRQRAAQSGDAGAARRAWWGRELAGAPLAVQLPVGGSGDDDAGPVRVELPAVVSAAVRAAAPQLRATPFMTVLAAFSVLLSRTTGQDDLVVATVVAHRDATELEPLLGCFTKKVPLRLRVDGDPSFREVVSRTRASLLGALSHQDVAFDAAVSEALGPPAAAHGVVPQVTVVFQGETPQRTRVALPGIAVGPYEPPAAARRERHFSARRGPDEAGGTPVWGDGAYLGTFLLLSLVEAPDGMALVARGVFDRPRVQELLDRFVELLAAAVGAPDGPVADLAADVARRAPVPDELDLRGLRVRRSRLEAALTRCPGVGEAAVAVRADGGEPRLVAYVVAEPGAVPPTLAQLRAAQWAALPGTPWPSALAVVDALPRLADGTPDVAALPVPTTGPPAEADPLAVTLATLWGEARCRPAGVHDSYWQDFSFLRALAEARSAGLAISDEQVARNRTPETLAADVAASGSL